MDGKTINDSPTIAGNGEAMLANRYRVVRQLGQGGMGSVWLAEDTQLDGKQFAIKMLPSILVSNKRAYRQLKDEALVAMKLTHPNIVTLRAFEENNGNPFLVMDYIDGQTLDDYLADKGTLGEDEVMGVLRPIAAALDYAHGEGVVHRDVKPANVMIRKDGHPFILDFGIAREIQETMTRVTGKLSSGTLLYMSPEQLNGDAPKREQDIYSFAAMAYECLKGEPPFVRGAIEDQIKNKIPESPVGRDDPIAPLAASVMAGLAKKPEDRPKSCAAVLEGKDSNRVERAERVEGNVSRRDAEAQSGGTDALRPSQDNGGARRPAEPIGARVPSDRTGGSRPVATVAGRRDPTPPNGDGFSRKEHKERKEVEGGKGSGIGKVLGILALLALFAALGGGGAWYYHQQREAVQREHARIAAERKVQAEEAKRKAEEKHLEAAQKAAKAEATQIRIEALVQQGKVSCISDEDGFRARKVALVDTFTRAEALFDEKTKRWSEAAQGFSNYVAQSKALIALDGERGTASEKRAEAVNARSRAVEAEAEKYAPTRWGEAVKLHETANGEFGRMEFASAKDTFGSVARQFILCADEAKAEQRARAEAQRKAEEEAARIAAAQRAREEAQRKAEEERKAAEKQGRSRAQKVQLWEGGPYWADRNVGAERPEDYGYHFWWGDTVGYKRVGDAWVASDGSSQNFSFDGVTTPTFRKDDATLKREGWITDDGVLAPEHDAARMHWGGSWRMPTRQELMDLRDKCDWSWTTMNGVKGYVVRGRGAYASSSIFLPCAGYGNGTSLDNSGSNGRYWSSVPSSGNYSNDAWSLYFNSGGHGTGSLNRYDGQPVRPVQGFTK